MLVYRIKFFLRNSCKHFPFHRGYHNFAFRTFGTSFRGFIECGPFGFQVGGSTTCEIVSSWKRRTNRARGLASSWSPDFCTSLISNRCCNCAGTTRLGEEGSKGICTMLRRKEWLVWGWTGKRRKLCAKLGALRDLRVPFMTIWVICNFGLKTWLGSLVKKVWI